MNKLRAFTLIELLVVIAIIAILAAILFPVFAQAKEAAKKTQALSDTKEIGTAIHLYINDYDDAMPSPWVAPSGKSVDVYQTLQPYIKNMNVFFSPDWTLDDANNCPNDNTPPGQFVPTEVHRCLGFGYNWGFGVWAGGALVGFEQSDGNGGEVLPGISATSVESPAELAAFGDTYNGRRYTMCAIGSMLQLYTGAQKNGSLRYGGSMNFAFVDGHAKSTKIQGYTFNPAAQPAGDGYIAVPADSTKTHKFFCATESGTVRPSNLGGPLSGAPDMPCGTFIDAVMSGAVLPLQKWSN